MLNHVIKNYKKLNKTSLRKDALDIIESGFSSLDIETILEDRFLLNNDCLSIDKKKYFLNDYKNIYVIGFGKSATRVGGWLEKKIGNIISDGVVIDVKKKQLRYLQSYSGSHPLPSYKNLRATSHIISLLKNASKDDLIITIVSGGGSALLSWPLVCDMEMLVNINKDLIKQGANIKEINIVRSFFSDIKGGHFIKHAYPATVLGLLFSDVPGNDQNIIASGPTVKGKYTRKEFDKIIKKYSILENYNLDLYIQEPEKTTEYFKKVYNTQILNNQVALSAMKEKAENLGYKVRILSNHLEGEAKNIGKKIAKIPQKGEVIIAGGETTVKVLGQGLGGRNQELVLSACENLQSDGLVMSIASDGIDNSSVAGALADNLVKQNYINNNINPKEYLKENNSFAFWHKMGAFIETGITGVNVADLMISMRAK